MKFKLLPVAVFVAFLLMGLAAAALAQEEIEVPPPYDGLENPFSWDDASAQEAGEVIYGRYCETCHGPGRDEEFSPYGPSFSTSDYRQSLEESPDFYFWTVSEGRLDKEMPPWGSSLSEEERWQVLTYLWSLGGAAPMPIPTPTPTLNPDEETPLNMWLIIGSVLGVLVVGGAVYYFVRSGR